MGIATSYCAEYLRPQENHPLGLPLETVRGFSPRLRELCGFGIDKGLNRHIDKHSPVDLRDGTGPRPLVGVMK